MGALAQVYQRCIVPRTDDHLTWVKAWENSDDETSQALREADLIVEQVLSTPLKLTLDQFETEAAVLQVPNILNGFLWPYAGEAHPLNDSIPNRPQGPFGPDLSDRFLNKLIRAGVNPDEALTTYMDMDVVKIAHVERFYEISVGWQRSLDERCGFDFAGLIERSFRDEHLFAQPGHPNLRFSRHFIATVFRRMGVRGDAIEQAIASLYEPPFPRGELPIHPKIATFFELKWIKPDHKYFGFTGESFTFEEYFNRYLKYYWNDKLFQSTIRARDPNLAEADVSPLIDDLREALGSSSGSSAGYFVLAKLLIRQGEGDKAIDFFRKSLALGGLREDEYHQIAEFSVARREFPEAERFVRSGIDAFPGSGELYHWLAIILARRGWETESILASRHALYLSPHHPFYKDHLANTLAAVGEFAEAEETIKAAIALKPTAWGLHFNLSRILMKQGRWADAIGPAERAIECDPDQAAVRKHIELLNERARQSLVAMTTISAEPIFVN